MDVRNFLPKEHCQPIFDAKSVDYQHVRASTGPSSVLLHRLHRLGWHWDQGLWDHRNHAIDLWESPIQDLRARAMEAWQDRAKGMVKHRKTMCDIHLTSPQLTIRDWPTSPSDQGLLRTSLNGTFYTNERQHHVENDVPTVCVFCGHTDSQIHRHWECSILEPARASCPTDIREELPQLPIATQSHGWIPTPSSLDPFREQLLAIPDTTWVHEMPADPPSTLDLFPDGTCLTPTEPMSRLAAWGFVQAGAMLDDTFIPIGHGLVPGLVQTVTRAELTAAKAAIQYAVRRQLPFRLWIDNALVVKHLRRTQAADSWEDALPARKVANHDLITDLVTMFGLNRHLCRAIVKVSSHQNQSGAQDDVDAWAWKGNDAADRCAAAALSDAMLVVQTHHKLHTEITRLHRLRKHVHATIIAVSRLALQLSKNQVQELDTSTPAVPAAVVPMVEWKLPVDLPEDAQHYWTADWAHISEWAISLHDPRLSARRWSWYQLFVDARLRHGVGPWYNDSTKIWEPAATCASQDFRRCLRSFKTFMNRVAIACGQALPVTFARPESFAILYWCQTIPVQVDDTRAAAVDRWLLSWGGAYPKPKALQRIDDLPRLPSPLRRGPRASSPGVGWPVEKDELIAAVDSVDRSFVDSDGSVFDGI
eukprot:Skav213049  [mRNA]  locus=scaffold3001:56101:58247:+ [translate_table: standard]